MNNATIAKLDSFTSAYIEATLWSSTDDEGNPLDSNYSAVDISDEATEQMIADCKKFQEENAADLEIEPLKYGPDYGIMGHAGHNFWLNRNGHGAGFWDGDYPEEVGERLSEASIRFGECDLYVGDDGKLYI